MKLKFKMVALAAALASLTGTAHADLITGANGSLALYAWNQTTNAWYVRDLGIQLNSFLPSSITTLSGDGGLTGTRTPEAGLLLNAGNTASFADASFAGWLTGQGATIGDVRWGVMAADASGGGANDRTRFLASSGNASVVVNNNSIDATAGAFDLLGGNLFGQNGDATYGFTLTGTTTLGPGFFEDNFLLGGNTLSTIGSSVGLYYFARTAALGSGGTVSATAAARYQNSANLASVSLAANGDFTYSLAAAPEVAAVPLPAAVWMMGAGLMALGGAARRRKAAAQA